MQALCAYSEDRHAAGASSVLFEMLTGLSIPRLDLVSTCVIHLTHLTVLFILGEKMSPVCTHHSNFF